MTTIKSREDNRSPCMRPLEDLKLVIQVEYSHSLVYSRNKSKKLVIQADCYKNLALISTFKMLNATTLATI